MTEPLPPRQELTASATDIGLMLPALGRVMVALSGQGATHERIGRVAHASCEGETLCLGGDAHDARLALPAVRSLVLDRTSRMREQSYPRIEFRDAAGHTQMSVVGMEGAAPFEVALAHVMGPALFPTDPPARPPAPPEAEDAATTLLRRLHAAGGRVRVSLSQGAARQAWEGALPEPRLAMGFVNLITPDFHLHLRLGSVLGFRVSAEGWDAVNEAGTLTGLRLMPMESEARAVLERNPADAR